MTSILVFHSLKVTPVLALKKYMSGDVSCICQNLCRSRWVLSPIVSLGSKQILGNSKSCSCLKIHCSITEWLSKASHLSKLHILHLGYFKKPKMVQQQLLTAAAKLLSGKKVRMLLHDANFRIRREWNSINFLILKYKYLVHSAWKSENSLIGFFAAKCIICKVLESDQWNW